MLTRSAANAAVGRASAMRRMRRRSANAHTSPSKLYCSTNGCTSYLVLDDDGRTAHCEICGYTRRLGLH